MPEKDLRANEVEQRLHTCSVCGTEGPWGPEWQWFGSLADIEDGRPVVKVCSKKCKTRYTRSAEYKRAVAGLHSEPEPVRNDAADEVEQRLREIEGNLAELAGHAILSVSSAAYQRDVPFLLSLLREREEENRRLRERVDHYETGIRRLIEEVSHHDTGAAAGVRGDT